MAENDDKKKLSKKHMENIDRVKKNLSEGKEIAKKEIQQFKRVYDNLDKAETQLEKEKEIASAFSTAETDDISEPSWIVYEGMVDRSVTVCSSAEAFVADLAIHIEKSEQLVTAASILDDLLSSSGATANIAFRNDTFLAPQVESWGVVANTINDNAEFIKSELNNICPDKVTAFEKIFMDWKTADPEIKYTTLLSLRSLIFNQIFDSLCEVSKYSKSPWFHGGKKRFCQTKYFILGDSDESNLIPTIALQINSIANDMQKYFDKLSEYGKHGHNQAITDALFCDVLSAFSQCLGTRKNYYV